MKKFFNKMFSNANLLINIACAILSVIVFALCILSVVSKLLTSSYDGSSIPVNVEENNLINGSYVTEGNTVNKDKIKFTKEADGTYGQTAVLEALAALENERTRAYNEGGVISKSNGITTATSMGVTVVQALSVLSGTDILGNKYYEEATKEVSSSGFGPVSAIRAFVDNKNISFEKSSNVSVKDNNAVGSFTGNNIQVKEYDKFLTENDPLIDLFPLGFSTNIDEIDLSSCKLSENMVGYKLTYNIKIDGNNFIKTFEKKFALSAEAVPNTTSISNYQINVNFNKYCQITSYDCNYAFKLKKNVMGGVWADTTGGLKTVINYKNADYRVSEL